MKPPSIQDVESASGIKRKSSETASEFIDRVIKISDIDPEVGEEVKEYILEARFSQKELIKRDSERVEEFYNSIQNLDNKLAHESDPSRKDQLDSEREISATDGDEPTEEVVNNPDRISKDLINTESPRGRKTLASLYTSRTSMHLRLRSFFDNSILFRDQNWFQSFFNLANKDVPYFLTVVAVGAWLFFRRLGHFSLGNWDEGTYAVLARNALKNGDWLVFHMHWLSNVDSITYQPYFEKPPLAIWFEAISMYIFGTTEFGARAPSAFFGVLCVVLVYFFARNIVGLRAAFLSSIAFATAPFVAATNNMARNGGVEMQFIFFGSLFVWFCWLTAKQSTTKYMPAIAAFGGAAVLTKGLAAGVFAFIAAPAIIISREEYLTIKAAKSILASIIFFGAWFVYVLAKYGEVVYEVMILDQVVGRVSGGFSGESGALFEFMQYPYFQRFPLFFDPWAYFLIPGIACLMIIVWEYKTDNRTDMLFFTWWTAFPLLFFAATGNHEWYIAPAFLPASVLVGWTLAEATRQKPTAIAATVSGVGLTLIFSFRVSEYSPFATPETPNMSGEPGGGLVFILVFLFGAIAVLSFSKIDNIATEYLMPDDRMMASIFIPILLVSAFTAGVAGTPAMCGCGLHELEKEVGMGVNQNTPQNAEIYMNPEITHGSAFQSFSFYADRSLSGATPTEANQDYSVRYYLMKNDTQSEITRNHSIIARMSHGGYDEFVLIKFSNNNQSIQSIRNATNPRLSSASSG